MEEIDAFFEFYPKHVILATGMILGPIFFKLDFFLKICLSNNLFLIKFVTGVLWTLCTLILFFALSTYMGLTILPIAYVKLEAP